MEKIKCVVVTPEATVLDETASFVVVPLFDGELGVAPQRSPLIGRLGFGELRLRQGDQTTRYYIDGGFVQVANDVVSVLTPRAIPAAEIDSAVLQEQLQDAIKRPTSTTESLETRDRLITQARAQLHVSRRASRA